MPAAESPALEMGRAAHGDSPEDALQLLIGAGAALLRHPA